MSYKHIDFDRILTEQGATRDFVPLGKVIRCMKAAIDADRKSRWISVKESLPKSGKKVILFQKVNETRIVRIFGFYAPKHTLEYEGIDEWSLEPDYDEEKDQYYIPEGFYELIENWPDFDFIAISKNEITHWQPLPENPEDL